MSELPLIIVNPQAAAGSTRERWAEIASDLRAHFGPFRVAFTKKPGDGTQLALEACKRGKRLIIACGGDGTINEVANGILLSEQDVELGILPSGTGGDFRRSLNISTEIRQAAKQLRESSTKLIDVGRILFTTDSGKKETRYFLNVASYGLSASVIKRVKSMNFNWLPISEMRGQVNFALSTLQEIIGLDYVYSKIKLDRYRESALSSLNFCICNARFFGGGMKIAPNAKLDDGAFDIVNIGNISALRVLLNSYTLYRGTHLDLPEVQTTSARLIEAKPFHTGQKIRLEADGELIGFLPAEFEIIPKALKIRVPA
ncbi:MAG: diacylglycerol kinase family lipid kinase [Acidobacteria bacterium]|nr:MAG: diacylglycerol kinase family lipid kinase [Acidobacteriota bacterium]